MNVVDQLPSSSRYAQAIAMDDELAQITLHDEEPAPTPPPLSAFTPEVRELRTIAERLGIAAQYLASLTGNRYVPDELPRPRTARDAAKREYGVQVHARVVAQLLPPEEA